MPLKTNITFVLVFDCIVMGVKILKKNLLAYSSVLGRLHLFIVKKNNQWKK